MRIPTNSLFQQENSMLNKQYEQLVLYANQITSQKKINVSSDDPILASQVKMSEDYIDSLNLYSSNQAIANSRTSLFESSMKDIVNVVGQIKTVVQNAQNDTLTNSDRAEMAKKLRGFLTGLLNDASVRDGNGQYIYSGNSTNTTPYVLQNGAYVYQGGYSPSYLNIDSSNTILYNESGYNVFGNILTGNGTFSVAAASTNTGSAFTSPGEVVNVSAYVPDTYTISFSTNSTNNLVYSVTGATTGNILTSVPFVPGTPITFNGINIPLTGIPNAGDSFQVSPSQPQNLFDSLNQLINELETPTSTAADTAILHQNLSQSAANFNLIADHLRGYLSEIGTRSSALKDQTSANANFVEVQTIMKGELEDVNYAEVISSYTRQMVSLQATQDSYVKLQQVLYQLLKF